MSDTIKQKNLNVPAYFIAFFTFIAVVNIFMVSLAFKTFSGLVTDNAYKKGIEYNKVIAAAQNQERLGWNGTIKTNSNRISFILTDKNGIEIKPEKVTASFSRPSKAGMDFSQAIQQGDNYINFPLNGLWEVTINAYYNDNHYQKIQRMVVE